MFGFHFHRLPAAALDFDNHATNIAQHGSLSRASLKKSSFAEDLGQKTLFGANPRIAVIHLVGTPAVIAVLVVMSTLTATNFGHCGTIYWHKKKMETVASTTLGLKGCERVLSLDVLLLNLENLRV